MWANEWPLDGISPLVPNRDDLRVLGGRINGPVSGYTAYLLDLLVCRLCWCDGKYHVAAGSMTEGLEMEGEAVMSARLRRVLGEMLGTWPERLRRTDPHFIFGTDEYGRFGNVTLRVSGRDICEAVAAIEGVDVMDVIRHTERFREKSE